jgi:hypothetical protein
MGRDRGVDRAARIKYGEQLAQPHLRRDPLLFANKLCGRLDFGGAGGFGEVRETARFRRRLAFQGGGR